MLVCRVIGRVGAARRLGSLDGQRLVVLEQVRRDGVGCGHRWVAVDRLGASEGQLVVTASAAAARMTDGLDGLPVDLSTLAILDREVQP